ncbi:MAG: hypothetical protein U5K51_17845, partial [Flavobacteriaceae bacterium]|nr:hypothetical protein [Flavobacteriaceae bacterium]
MNKILIASIPLIQYGKIGFSCQFINVFFCPGSNIPLAVNSPFLSAYDLRTGTESISGVSNTELNQGQ